MATCAKCNIKFAVQNSTHYCYCPKCRTIIKKLNQIKVQKNLDTDIGDLKKKKFTHYIKVH